MNDLPSAIGAKYIAKPGGWFDAGTECVLVDDCGAAGWLMCGQRRGKLDEELCGPDEFEVIPE